ncbi:5'-nucleotidase /3'-nucleotidase /exopolyphosphatase [Dethiosulfatibacter aminovorans DSM 17477]|uniref:5'-nucleotidase n=1 Tax=Dethiosulfatibacter aminovorans DSM 17477 TaxID=1121476 RepID=A0A1M6IYL1_9FIRM|nr:5'/3'-nucleotidase SurE [Dethiosulfatibacter aminovorans]SHJ39529.1 5'-nucleotidase /3'-nucleotidase /exopolyphosphatase [Dethiosulfatibacter aminovorans DSM 17477]
MRPYILITNDDGILSPGIKAAVRAVKSVADILIVAPRFQQTGMGRSFPRNEDTGIIEKICLDANQSIYGYGVHGSPAQAVAHGILELASRKPDLCISGINYGVNLGISLTCSGTIGAAYEAFSHGIKTIAFSYEVPLNEQRTENFMEIDWTIVEKTIKKIVLDVLENGFADEISIYNVNIPNSVEMDTEIRMTTQSRFSHSIFKAPDRKKFDERLILETVPDPMVEFAEKESDIYAIEHDRIVSVTPLGWKQSII